MDNQRNLTACPKCGRENPPDAQFCNACGGPMAQKGQTTQSVTVRLSGLAVASLVLGVLSILVTPLAIILTTSFDILCIVVPLWALILGVVSLVQIETSGGRITGRGFAVAGLVIPAALLLLVVMITVSLKSHSIPFRMVCGTNLSGIGKAMLIYANDYDDELPRAGGKSTVWAAKIPDWKAENRFSAYQMQPDGSGGQASISASLYLLVKYAEVQPKSFICKDDAKIKEFKPDGKILTDLWDFGSEPQKHCSYSYHNPYGPFALTTAGEPGSVVAADRNPWMASSFVKARDFGKFNPEGDREAIKAGNAVAHKFDGQNVLFLDNHVGFEKSSCCGVNDDNIYTSWDGQNIRRGVPPKLGSRPESRTDSLLVNDPIVPR